MQRSVRHSAASPHKMPQASSGTAGITVSSDPRFAIGWQEDQADPIGDGQAFGSMPAGVVEHEDDAAVAARASLAGEGGEQFGKEGLGEAGTEIPERLAAGRLHEGSDVQP